MAARLLGNTGRCHAANNDNTTNTIKCFIVEAGSLTATNTYPTTVLNIRCVSGSPMISVIVSVWEGARRRHRATLENEQSDYISHPPAFSQLTRRSLIRPSIGKLTRQLAHTLVHQSTGNTHRYKEDVDVNWDMGSRSRGCCGIPEDLGDNIPLHVPIGISVDIRAVY